MIRSVLLDIDGTFLDSNDAHADAWLHALKHFGYHKDRTEVRRCIGMGGDNLLPTLIRVEADSARGKEISEFRDTYFRETYLWSLKAFPGSRDLIKELQKRKFKRVVATSSNKKDVSKLLQLAQIDDLVSDIVTGEDVKNSKPDADIVARALKCAGVEPAEAAMIGDTPYDITAAEKAGVFAIAFRCGGWTDKDLATAAAIYDGPEDLLNNLPSSLLGRTT